MASPMFEIPDHLGIPVDADGLGPVELGSPDYHHTECWCGDRTCLLWHAALDDLAPGDTAAAGESDE